MQAGAWRLQVQHLKSQSQAKLNLAHGAGAGYIASRGRTEIGIRRSETDKIVDIRCPVQATNKRRPLGVRLKTLEEKTSANLDHAHCVS